MIEVLPTVGSPRNMIFILELKNDVSLVFICLIFYIIPSIIPKLYIFYLLFANKKIRIY